VGYLGELCKDLKNIPKESAMNMGMMGDMLVNNV